MLITLSDRGYTVDVLFAPPVAMAVTLEPLRHTVCLELRPVLVLDLDNVPAVGSALRLGVQFGEPSCQPFRRGVVADVRGITRRSPLVAD